MQIAPSEVGEKIALTSISSPSETRVLVGLDGEDVAEEVCPSRCGETRCVLRLRLGGGGGIDAAARERPWAEGESRVLGGVPRGREDGGGGGGFDHCRRISLESHPCGIMENIT